jgi:hypothetical protein
MRSGVSHKKTAPGNEHNQRAGTRQSIKEEELLAGEEIKLFAFTSDCSVR